MTYVPVRSSLFSNRVSVSNSLQGLPWVVFSPTLSVRTGPGKLPERLLKTKVTFISVFSISYCSRDVIAWLEGPNYGQRNYICKISDALLGSQSLLLDRWPYDLTDTTTTIIDDTDVLLLIFSVNYPKPHTSLNPVYKMSGKEGVRGARSRQWRE